MTPIVGILVTIVSLANIAGLMYLLASLRRRPGETAGTGETTGHVWDEDLRELNNPLPRWWLWLFILTVIFGLGYLVIYPGLGNYGGTSGWSSQRQYKEQTVAAEAAGLKPDQVNVHTTLLGGGFGRRLEVDFVPAAVQASKAVGAPVKLIWTREDDITHDVFRPPAREEVSAGLDEKGQLLAWTLHITGPSITARFDPTNKNPFDSVIEYVQNFPYEVPNFDLRYTRQEIGFDVGYLRSVSHAPNCFAIESSMDEIAATLGRNPLDFRLQLLTAKSRHTRVLRLIAERAGWGHAPPGRYQGIAFMEGYASCLAQVAEVSIESGGRARVHKVTCVIDCGQTVNPRIVESQLESGIIYGLSAALWGDITVRNGRVQQRNFNDYRVLRLNETPEIDVYIVPSDGPPGGIGEIGVPPIAPAVCNAIFAATGKRLRSLPISAHTLT